MALYRQYYSPLRSMLKGLAVLLPAEIGAILAGLPPTPDSLAESWPLHLTAAIGALLKVLHNYWKNKHLPRKPLDAYSLFFGLALAVIVATPGCVTTKTTLPDGTVIEEQRLDAQQVQLASQAIQELAAIYQELQAGRGERDAEEWERRQALLREREALLVQFLSVLRAGPETE